MGTRSISLDFDLLLKLTRNKFCSSLHLSSDLGEGIWYHLERPQRITTTFLELDKKLLKKSQNFFGLIKREYLYIKISTKFGDVKVSKFIRGERASVSSYKQIKSLINDLSFDIRKSGDEVKQIEIVHSHLHRQYVELSEKGEVQKLVTRPLSKADLNLLVRLKDFITAPILMRAVTLEKISYEVLL